MDSLNNPATSDTSAERWRLVLLILCAVGACLVIGILALQVAEYLSYKAPPDVWPQPVAGGTISAPLLPVTPTMPSVPPVPVTTTAAPSVSVVSAVVSSAPVVAATSAPAPIATIP